MNTFLKFMVVWVLASILVAFIHHKFVTYKERQDG